VNRRQSVTCLLLLSNEISIKRDPFVWLANNERVMVNFTAGWVDCKCVLKRELDFFRRLEYLALMEWNASLVNHVITFRENYCTNTNFYSVV
jgi:hypothetical protein